MKNFKRLLVLALVVCFALGVMLFAACDNKVIVKLDVGTVGTLSSTSVEAKAGDKLTDVVKNITPQTEQGITFAGWFLGDKQITDNDVVPKGGVTLVAKYDAAYTVKVYYRDAVGSFGSEPTETTTGAARFGEAFEVDVGEFYGTLNQTQPNRLSTDALGKNEVFSVYMDVTYFRVKYNINRSGLTATLPEDLFIVGSSPKLADGNDFGLPANVRFVGWSESSTGEVKYRAGDIFDTTDRQGATTLYAQWDDNALTDFFGGSDYLFAVEKENAVYLHRQGLDERKGSYNSETGVFAFEEEGNVKLEGKVSGENYYYFEDLTGQTAVSGTGNGDTITFNGSNSVTYKSGAVSTEGTYDIDPTTGEYIFTADGLTFVFAVNTQTSSSGVTLVFNRANSQEKGFYLDETGKTAIYLDGMIDENGIGGAMLYRVTDGKLVAAMRIFYYEWEDNVIVNDGSVKDFYLFDETTYVACTSSGEKMFLFRIADEERDSVDGVEIRGTYTPSDGLDGHYFGDALDEEPDLLLDGFGKVKQKKGDDYVEGTYQIETNTLKVLENDEFIEWTDEWVKITVDGETVYQRLYVSILPFHGVVDRPVMREWAHLADKIYVGAEKHDKVYLYDSTINGAYVMLQVVSEQDGTYYVSVDRGVVSVENEEQKLYRFTTNLYSDGTSWLFKYDQSGKIETTVELSQVFESEDGKLAMDEWGTLTYNGVSYPFGSWARDLIFDYTDKFALEFFYKLEGEKHSEIVSMRLDYTSQTDSEGTTTIVTKRTPLDESKLVDLVWNQFYGQEGYYDILYFVDENHALIGFPTMSGSYVFVVEGTIGAGRTDGEFRFQADPDNFDEYNKFLNDENLTQTYMDFYFKYVQDVEGKYAIKYVYKDEYTSQKGEQFRVDGYGNAVFVDENKTEKQGTYEAIDSFGKYLYEFVSGSETHRISVIYDENGKQVDFLVDPSGTGIYYLIYDDGYLYRDSYVILLGNATKTTPGTAIYGNYLGTYIGTGEEVYYLGEDGWTEYQLVMQVKDDEGNPAEDIVCIITKDDFQIDPSGETADVFFRQMTPQAGIDFEIDDYAEGVIQGDGYSETYLTFDGDTYYLGTVGIGNISDRSPLASDYGWRDDFQNGAQVIFKADYRVNMQEGTQGMYSRDFLFDVLPNGKLSLRDNLNATYALYSNGNITSQRLYLDGHGHAEFYDANGNLTDEGNYQWMNTLESMLFTSTREGGATFNVKFAQMSFSDELWYVYFVVDEEQVFVGDDWSVLLLGDIRESDNGGIYNGYYVDRMGYSYEGFYSFLAEDVVRFEFSNGGIAFYDVANGKFFVNNEQFIVRDHALLGYQGDVITDLIIPDEVTRIASGAFSTVWSLGGPNYIFDLNNVEIIDDYAFFGVHELNVVSIESEKVTRVGAYAFYMPFPLSTSSSQDWPFSWLRDVSFPNATYIGDYAFNANNQMCLGITRLNKVTHIGAYAFSHNARLSHEKMVLDLTGADVAAIKMDRNAFLPGPNTDIWEQEGWPVTIWVQNEAAKAIAEQNWFEEIAKCVEVRSSSMEGVGYFDFASRSYLRFGGIEEGVGVVEYYELVGDNYQMTESFATYAFENGNVKLTAGNTVLTFDKGAKTIKLGNKTFYRTDSLAIFNVTEENGTKAEFRFNFSVETEQESVGYTLRIDIGSANYNGITVENANMDSTDYACSFRYTAGETVYNITVSFADWTAKSTPYGITVEDANGEYRAKLENPITYGYQYLSLEQRLSGESYVTLFEDVRRNDVNLWIAHVVTGNLMVIYTVRYDPNANSIAVETEMYNVVTLTTEDNLYRVMFSYEEADRMSGIVSFAQWDEEEEKFNYIYNSSDMNSGVRIKQDSPNNFTVTSSANGERSWKIAYEPQVGGTARLVVEELEQYTVVRNVASEHVDDNETGVHENYYVFALLVNSKGDVVGIDEFAYNTYGRNGYSGGIYIMVNNEENRGDGVFVFTNNGQTYTVTIQKITAEDGTVSYKVNVSVEPAE